MRLFLLSLIFVCHLAHSEETQWKVGEMQHGCFPLSELYGVYPELVGKNTPREIAAALKKKYKKVRVQPYLNIYEENKKSSETYTERDIAIRKLFTKSNIIVISWAVAEQKESLLLITAELCKSLGSNSFSH